MVSSLNIALPTIGNEFGTDAILLSWISASFLLTSAIFTLPFGRIADIYGLKRIFTYGITIYVVFSFLSGIVPSAVLLILFRAFQGLCASMMFGTGVAILTSVFPPAERGHALGVNLAGVYFGLSIGPFFGRNYDTMPWLEKYFLFKCVAGFICDFFCSFEVKRGMD